MTECRSAVHAAAACRALQLHVPAAEQQQHTCKVTGRPPSPSQQRRIAATASTLSGEQRPVGPVLDQAMRTDISRQSCEHPVTVASAGACKDSLRFYDMTALTGCDFDFATACAAPDRALCNARRSSPAGTDGSEMLSKPWQHDGPSC